MEATGKAEMQGMGAMLVLQASGVVGAEAMGQQLSGWLALKLCLCPDSRPRALLNTDVVSFVFLHHLSLSCPMLSAALI